MFLYDANKTMKMLGKQYPTKIIGIGGIAADDFGDVLSAYTKKGITNIFDVSIDIFMLGYIYGKRAERARRKKA